MDKKRKLSDRIILNDIEDIEDIDKLVGKLQRKRRKLEDELITKIREENKFLFCVGVYSFKGSMDNDAFHKHHGCFSTYDKVMEVVDKYKRFGQQFGGNYYCIPAIQPVENFDADDLREMDMVPDIASNYTPRLEFHFLTPPPFKPTEPQHSFDFLSSNVFQ